MRTKRRKKGNSKIMMYIFIAVAFVVGIGVKFYKNIKEFLNSDKFAKLKQNAKEKVEIAEENNLTVDEAALASSWEHIQHFVPSEFNSRGQEGTGYQMDIDYVSYLDRVRDTANMPFHVGSGFRTPEHNADIKYNGKQYSAKNSPHMHGIASDITFNSFEDAVKAFESYMAVRAVLRPEWKLGLGFYGSKRHEDAWFIHSDNRKHTTEKDVLWFSDRYNRGQYRNVPQHQKDVVQAIFDKYKT